MDAFDDGRRKNKKKKGDEEGEEGVVIPIGKKERLAELTEILPPKKN